MTNQKLDIETVIKKAMYENTPKGHCSHCKKLITDKRKKHYCSGNCAYDSNKYGVKAKYRNHKYMYIYLGTGYSRGQGRRSGSMILGAMSVAQDMWSDPVPVTKENVKRSLSMHSQKINLCNSAWLSTSEALLLAEYLNSNK